MKLFRFLYLLFLVLALGCDPEIEVNVVPQSGNADFTNYIAIGNSLTAGYADNGLYPEAQATSFPKLLSEQMKAAGYPDLVFNQPLMPGTGSGYLYLTSISPLVLSERTADLNAYAKINGPFNNLGIPGIRAKDITVVGLGTVNPYLGRVLPQGQELKSYIELIAESEPTFFTCWIGNNDILGYAVSGGAYGTEGAPGTGINGITPLDQFTLSYAALMNAVGDAKGVVITVPDILLAPLFTTIPKALIPLTDQNIVDQLNAGYADYNQGVELYNSQVPASHHLRKIEFSIGLNYPVVEDKSIPFPDPGKISQLTPDGYLLLTLPTANLATGWGTAVPIPDQYVLTATEVQNIRTATLAFNNAIKSYATSNANIGVFESTPLLHKVANGMIIDGAVVSSDFITGGVFSLDGAHLTPRGNALVANEVIKVINSKFNALLPPIQVTAYPGVNFPQ